MQNTDGAAVDFIMLHTVYGPVSKLRSLIYRMIPFLAAEVRSGSGNLIMQSLVHYAN